MGLLQEFKTFALKGNVVDMAVGVIIGGAFGKIVTSLVNDIIMPPLGVLLGGANFSDLAVKIQRQIVEVGADGVETVVRPEVLWKYGAFLQTCLDFLIIAMSIFVMIKVINRLTSLRKKEEEDAAAAAAAPAPEPEPEPEPEPTKEEVLLTEIRDLLKSKQ